MAVGRDRHGDIALACGDIGSLPAQACVAGQVDARLVGIGRHRDQQIAVRCQGAPAERRVRGQHAVDLGLGLAGQPTLGDRHGQRAHILGAGVAVEHIAGAEIAVQVGQRAGEGAGAVRAPDRHVVGAGSDENTVDSRQRDGGHGRSVAGKRLAAEVQSRIGAPHRAVTRRYRHRRRARQRPESAQHRRRQHAREIKIRPIAAGFDQAVVAKLASEDVGIHAIPARELVDPQQRVQGVLARVARQLVAALTAKQDVVASAAGQAVVASAGHESHRRCADRQRLQIVVAKLVGRGATPHAHQDGVVAVAADRVDRHGVEQVRSVEPVVAGAQVDLDLLDAGELLVEAVELDVYHASRRRFAAEDPALRAVEGVEEAPVAGLRAREQRQRAAGIDAAQHRLDRGGEEIHRPQREAAE